MKGNRLFIRASILVMAALVLPFAVLGCGLLPTFGGEPQIEFAAREDEVERGECTVLEWHVRGAEGYLVFLDGEEVDVSGREEVCPEETTGYTLAVGAPGGPYEDRVTIQVVPGPGPAPAPTQTPVPPSAAPTTESREPVEISLWTAAEEERVAANTPIFLRLGWITDTPEQVADFLRSLELVVSLDGEVLRDTGNYWSEIEGYGDADQDGDTDYLTQWLYPVGVLAPGTHRVEGEIRLQWPVADGSDSDGDGLLDEFSGPWNFSLQIVVGE